LAVGLEAARALGAVALLPVHVLGYGLSRSTQRKEIREDLGRPAVIDPGLERLRAGALSHLPQRPLRIFIACAEPSGEMHARSFLRALRAHVAAIGGAPPVCSGIGGGALEAEGVRLLARPVERASMGFTTPLASLPYYLGVLRACAAHFSSATSGDPDIVVAIDSPALNVPLGRIAQRYGVPVVHFIAPQYWGWAPWRSGAYKRAVDRALTILPFEAAWFARRGIGAAHVGHPALDALAKEPVTRPSENARDLVLLPGSRRSVIQRNLPWMLGAATRLRHRFGDVPIVIAQADGSQSELVLDIVRAGGAETWARVEIGGLHRVLSSARSALSVSGTILIDLLHHRLPTVVVYRLANRPASWLALQLLTVPYFASVNLLAGRAVYPEFSFAGEGPAADIDRALAQSYADRAWRAECIRGLDLASERLGPAGASDRAAWTVLELVDRAHARDRVERGGRFAGLASGAP
jgi:lipid-A-disaccharide synthase